MSSHRDELSIHVDPGVVGLPLACDGRIALRMTRALSTVLVAERQAVGRFVLDHVAGLVEPATVLARAVMRARFRRADWNVGPLAVVTGWDAPFRFGQIRLVVRLLRRQRSERDDGDDHAAHRHGAPVEVARAPFTRPQHAVITAGACNVLTE